MNFTSITSVDLGQCGPLATGSIVVVRIAGADATGSILGHRMDFEKNVLYYQIDPDDGTFAAHHNAEGELWVHAGEVTPQG